MATHDYLKGTWCNRRTGNIYKHVYVINGIATCTTLSGSQYLTSVNNIEKVDLDNSAHANLMMYLHFYTAAANNFWSDAGTSHDEDLPSYKKYIYWRDALLKLIAQQQEDSASLMAQNIRNLFDMVPFNPTGTVLDHHMARRTTEEIEAGRQYNLDHSWAALSAQSTIDEYLKKRKGGQTNGNAS